MPQTLQLLDLGGNEQLGAEGARAIAPHLPPTLVELFLHDNTLGDEGVRALAPRLPPTLRTLCLSGTHLGAEGAYALAPHLPPSLQELDLTNNARCPSSEQVLARARADRITRATKRALAPEGRNSSAERGAKRARALSASAAAIVGCCCC